VPLAIDRHPNGSDHQQQQQRQSQVDTTSPESTAIVVGGSVSSQASVTGVEQLKGQHAEALLSMSTTADLDPTKLDLSKAGRSFVDAYFRHVHRVYPFVDKSAILESMQGMDDLSPRYDYNLSSNKLYLIMAIGCTTLERAGEMPVNTSPRFKVRYSMIVDMCLKAGTVESVETLFLLCIYSLFDPVGMSPWSLVGVLTRQAMAVGVTRRLPKTEAPLSPYQSELRHRLYWSVFVLDRMLSTSLGLPFGLTDENCDIPLPGITIEEFDTGDRMSYTNSLQICRHVIQLRQLEEAILKSTHLSNIPKLGPNTFTSFDRETIKQDFRGQVDDWYSQGCLLSAIENDNLPFHNTITWLTVRYYNLLILLYSPSKLNPALSTQDRLDLQTFTQKYLQSSCMLLQQRQLPLNWVTLYRCLSICSVLLYCFVQPDSFISRDEITLCADILEAFPTTWAVASRTAAMFRQFASLAAENGLGPELRYKWFVHVKGAGMRLSQECLGRSSAFCFPYHLIDSARGWSGGGHGGGNEEARKESAGAGGGGAPGGEMMVDGMAGTGTRSSNRGGSGTMSSSEWDGEPNAQAWRYGSDYF
jgi:hypothetical protein